MDAYSAPTRTRIRRDVATIPEHLDTVPEHSDTVPGNLDSVPVNVGNVPEHSDKWARNLFDGAGVSPRAEARTDGRPS